MGGNEEKRMAGDHVIIHALTIGDRVIVLGENPNGAGDERYMCAFCKANGLFASYTEVMVSEDYPEIVKPFGERVAERAEKTRIDLNSPKLQGIPQCAHHRRGLRSHRLAARSPGKSRGDQAGSAAPGIPPRDLPASAMHWRFWRVP